MLPLEGRVALDFPVANRVVCGVRFCSAASRAGFIRLFGRSAGPSGLGRVALSPGLPRVVRADLYGRGDCRDLVP